jgi:hypothetical protein
MIRQKYGKSPVFKVYLWRDYDLKYVSQVIWLL